MCIKSFPLLLRPCTIFSSSLLHGSSRSLVTKSVEAEQPVGWDEAKSFSEIPGPRAYPVIRCLPYFARDLPVPITDIFETHKHFREKFGPLVRFEMPAIKPMLIVFEPEMLEYVIKHGLGKWPLREFSEYFGIYRKKTRRDWYDGVAGLIPENGEAWWEIQSQVQQPMMRPKTSHQYLPAMNGVTDDFIKHIRTIRSEDTKEVPEDFLNELYKWSLESVGVVALNTRLGCLGENCNPDSDGQKLIDHANAMFQILVKLELSLQLWKYIPTWTWRKFVRIMDQITSIAMVHIDKEVESLKKKTPGDLENLSVLERFLTTPGMKKGVAVTMVIDMLIAGIDTTGTSMGFLLANLGKNPDVQEKLQQEVDRVLPNRDDPVTPEVINSLPYLKAVIKESMRITPLFAGFGRTTGNDFVLEGYKVPKGTSILASNMLMGLDDHYYPEANKFKPERWLRGSEQQNKANPFSFQPFGNGSRMCIGRRIAEQELWLLGAKIMKNFSVKYHHEEIGFTAGSIHKPNQPLRFQFRDRR